MVPLIFDLLSTKVAGWFQNVEDIIKSWGELLKKFVAAWRVYLLKTIDRRSEDEKEQFIFKDCQTVLNATFHFKNGSETVCV